MNAPPPALVRTAPGPDTFAPDRRGPGCAAAMRASFLAFGDGRRKRLGEDFARAGLHIVLASLPRT
ncbi:hypothetical protein ACFVS9_18280 [Streptomyces sp. NPDC058008]|uniref:hypothetical protein n=1 Tax=Streptomyces sp. NPDC058008 TaxID=3346303 RepID=UPI0036E92A6D